MRQNIIDPIILRSDDFQTFMDDRQKRLLTLIEPATDKAAYAGTIAEEGEDIEFGPDTIEADKTVTLA